MALYIVYLSRSSSEQCVWYPRSLEESSNEFIVNV